MTVVFVLVSHTSMCSMFNSRVHSSPHFTLCPLYLDSWTELFGWTFELNSLHWTVGNLFRLWLCFHTNICNLQFEESNPWVQSMSSMQSTIYTLIVFLDWTLALGCHRLCDFCLVSHASTVCNLTSPVQSQIREFSPRVQSRPHFTLCPLLPLVTMWHVLSYLYVVRIFWRLNISIFMTFSVF